jgi:hypothetical protein
VHERRGAKAFSFRPPVFNAIDSGVRSKMECSMRRHVRSIVIAATITLAAVPMLAGCVVAPGYYGYHGYWHGHWRR